MEYRQLPHGGEPISVIGLGGGSLPDDTEKAFQIVNAAIESGVNFFDLALSFRAPLYAFGKAFSERREKVLTQMHFGAFYDKNGKYGWTRDLGVIREQFAENLKAVGTDYTDFGFIHCTDDQEDLDKIMAPGGLWDYMKFLKAEGKIRHLGFSSHEPGIARQLLETGMVDLFMFSINPAYDYQKGTYGKGKVEERAQLYRDCEKEGIGISVMKPFAGGQLLDKRTSLFKRTLTHAQCIQYVLDRPAVLTVLPGVRNLDDLHTVLHYEDTTLDERDYSVISDFAPVSAEGTCVYCNHCQPCPVGLNVGLINKYYDLALAGDEMAKGHYEKLPLHASDCVKCGHCEGRCPFHVKQENRMEEIAAYFSK